MFSGARGAAGAAGAIEPETGAIETGAIVTGAIITITVGDGLVGPEFRYQRIKEVTRECVVAWMYASALAGMLIRMI